MQVKKFLVLGILFMLPIVAYLFFASGINNFAKLPILTESIDDVKELQSINGTPVSLDDKITILGFLGSDLEVKKTNAFNLNQKIYKHFYEFKDFQFVMVSPLGSEEKAQAILDELGQFTDVSKWNFVFGTPTQIEEKFKSLKSNLILDENSSSPFVFIIDKERNLRGRDDDDDHGLLYGFDAISVAELGNKMKDDVKVVLAEYRLALKKNSANRQK
jgi:hypothetical protein